MIKRKAKRMLAGLCVALMLSQSVGESALVAVAAENIVEVPAQEDATADLGGVGDTESEAEEAADTEAEADTEEAADGAAAGVEEEAAVDDAAEASSEEADAETEGEEADGGIVTLADDDGTEADGETEEWETIPSGVRVSNKTGDIEVYLGQQSGWVNFGKIDAQGVLTVNASETGIYDNMFEEWDRVTELRFEENAKAETISKYSFRKCTNLTKIDLSNCPALVDIGMSAFSGCSNLQTIIFHDNLQYIRKQAFENCTSLQSITLTPGLIRVEDLAFNGCEKLSTVKLETSNVRCLTSGGSAAAGIFKGCNIREIIFALRNMTGDNSQDNIIVPANLFNTAGFADDANIVIPSNIQEIGEGAFYKATNLKHVTFEDSEQKPSALTTIGKNAFFNTALTEITFPATVQTIGESAFESCTGLTELVIPNTVNVLNNKAFRACNQISSLTLSNATTTVGDYVFENCTSLTKVELPEGLTFTGKGEFKGCSKLAEVKLPSTVETIGNETFMNCIPLTDVTLPDSVTAVGDSAFENCMQLTDVKYSQSLRTIGKRAFYNCIVLTSNVFPETLETIGESAFYMCQRFVNLTIPAKVTSIGKAAFQGCIRIDVLTLTSENLTCGSGVFNGCYLTTVNFPEGITKIPVHLFDQATFTADYIMIIPNTVKEVGDYAFCGSKTADVNLTRIEFETGTQLEKIGNYAFSDCIAIESFTIPDTTLEIGQNAFAGCIKLSSIVIPENVTKIGTSAFSGCSVLSEITYNAIEVTTSNQNIFAGCNVKIIRIGEKVRAFPANLFRGAQFSTNTSTGEEEMISIYIPASVETIGAYALPNIANLQHVVFADGSKLTEIGQYAFQQCVNMESCNLPDSVTTIGNSAFTGCTKLGSDKTRPFKIPSSLVTLGSSAFYECPALTEVVIPEGVKKISDKAFMNDTGLTSALLQGGSLTEIGVSAFEGCTSLTEISIPNGVTKIGATAFKNCAALTKVVIPASVTSIGNDAFAGCSSDVQYLVVPGSYAEQWLADNNLESSKLKTITYVLDGGANAPQNPAGYEPGDTFTFGPATRKGYEFKGWYLDANFRTEIISVENQTENLTIYAKWEIEVYTITYVLNGGINHKDNPTSYTVEDTVKLENATKEGASFEGWYTDLSNTRSKVTSISKGNTGDKILYAKWSGGGVVSDPTASIESGSKVKAGTKLFLSTSTPGARIYYTLDGSEPNEQSTLYADGIVIDTAITVRAIAMKDGCDPSGIVIFTYDVIDETKEWGDIDPEDQAQFTDASKVPEGIWVAGVEDEVVYTGKKITFDNLRVYDHKTLLKEKTDYTVKYSNNQNAAETNAKKAPTVTVTAKGNYKGKAVIYFSIKPKDISSEEFSAEDLFAQANGKVQKPAPVLYYGKSKLKIKKDYQIDSKSAGGYTEANTYEVELQGTGNYTGKRIINFTLANGVSLTKAKIKGLAVQAYTGEEIKQNFTVSVGSTVLTEGTNYDVEYSNNVDAGTATVTIIGKGDYFGIKKATFKITPIATLSKVKFELDKTSVDYTGNAYEIGSGINVTANFNGKLLEKDVDYTCSYKSNVNAGTATVTFTGKGGYSGTAKKTFKIKGADFSVLGVVEFLDDKGNVKADNSYAFVQGGVKPAVRISYGGQILTAGTDYTTSYKNNAGKGTGSIVIKGKKNFAGTITRQFEIKQQDLEKLSVSATDVVWKNEAGIVETSQVTVKDVNGKALVAGTDYKVTFAYEYKTTLANGTNKNAGTTVGKNDIIPAETVIRVTIAPAGSSGNYTGKAVTLIRLCKKSIASAKVKVNQQTYTGSEVQPGMDQMTVTLGRDTLTAGDYEIVGYENNIKKGTAKVTIRGIGNYGGTKTVSFKIVQKPFDLKATLFNLFF